MAPSDLVFVAGFAAYLGIRIVYERRIGKTAMTVRRVDLAERIVMLLVVVGALVLPAAYLLTPWLAFADYRLPAVAPFVGAPVMAFALWLFWRSHADLGRNWAPTLELRSGHALVTQGVYRSIRHPMYAAIWLFNIAQGLLLQNWLAGWGAVTAFAVMYALRAPREERMLREAFGQPYADYMRRTGRIVPRWRVQKEANRLTPV